MEGNSQKDLIQLLKHYNGLLSLKPKIPIRDSYSLSLVYTPGVGKSCLEIKADNKKSFIYTNKGNSIIVLTDSSAFTQDPNAKWSNDASIPFVEAKSVYYKLQTNVDAYPIVLDLYLIQNDQDIYDVLRNLAPAYSGFELLHVSEQRIKGLLEIFESKPLNVVLITNAERAHLQSKLEDLQIFSKVDLDLLIACTFRAALDTQSYGRFPHKILDDVAEFLASQPDLLLPHNFFKLAAFVIRIVAEKLFEHKLAQNTTVTPKDVEHKFLIFLLEGTHAWIELPLKDNITLTHSIDENSLDLHKRYRGMVETDPKIRPRDPFELKQLFNSEQLLKVAQHIRDFPESVRELTCKSNFCSIITNGTAILGFGDIGSEAGLPVMEGKGCLFKQLGGVDLMPICILEKNPEKAVEIIRKIAPIFSMINLEDIKGPECFEIENALIESLDIPVFHDDQHGTAIVVLAALLNSIKLAEKKISDVKIVINGAGAAGICIAKLLHNVGAGHIVVCDTEGAIYKGRPKNMNKYKDLVAEYSNEKKEAGALKEVLKAADVFIGVSAPGAITQEDIKTMNSKAIVFALANPIPEILPDEAKAAGAFIVATGRSDFKNQVNNSLAFPGIFRGCLDIQARKVTTEMKVAAANGLASLVRPEELSVDHIIPGALDLRVPQKVAKTVAEAGIKEGVARKQLSSLLVEERIRDYLVEGILRSYDVDKKL